MGSGPHPRERALLGATLSEAEEHDDLTIAELAAPADFEPERPIAPLGWPRRPPAIGTVPPPVADVAAAIPRLVVTAGRDHGRVFHLSPGVSLSIGRARDNAVSLSDIAVSRHHLVLRWNGSSWSVDDCGSSNGIRVNEAPAVRGTPLRDGDSVEVGNTLLQLEYVRPAPDSDPARALRRNDRPSLSRVSATTERHIHTVDPDLVGGFAPAPPPPAPPPITPAARPAIPPRRGSTTAGELSTDTGVIRAPGSLVCSQPPTGGWSEEHNHFLVRVLVATLLGTLGFAAMMTTSEPPPRIDAPTGLEFDRIERWVSEVTAAELSATQPWYERAYRRFYSWFEPADSGQ